MKKIIYILMIVSSCCGVANAFDLIGAGVTAVDVLVNGGKMSAADKVSYENEIKKEEKEREAKAHRQMEICVELMSLKWSSFEELEHEVAQTGNQEFIDYVNVLKNDDKEFKRCANRQEREVLIQEQEQKQYEAMIKNTSYLYQLLELQ